MAPVWYNTFVKTTTVFIALFILVIYYMALVLVGDIQNSI